MLVCKTGHLIPFQVHQCSTGLQLASAQGMKFPAALTAASLPSMPPSACSGAAAEAPGAVFWRAAPSQRRAALRATMLEGETRTQGGGLTPPATHSPCTPAASLMVLPAVLLPLHRALPPCRPPALPRHRQDAAGQGGGHRVLHLLPVGQGAGAHQHVCGGERAPDPRGGLGGSVCARVCECDGPHSV